MNILLAALLLAASPTPSPVTAGQLRALTYTTADWVLYVDPLGSDANACTAAGASACLTIQGALNKPPKVLRHRLTVNVAAGNYAGFHLSGFSHDVSRQQTTGGIVIDGALANSTGLASGTATGTATAATSGSHSTYGTLTDSGQSWTVNDLRGRFVTITSGTGVGVIRTICSNTATEVTVCGQGFSAGVGSGYAVRDSTVIIATAVATPATGTVNSSANNAGVWIAGNVSDYSSNQTVILLRNLRFTATSANGIVIRGPGQAVSLTQIQFANGSATSNRVFTTDGPGLAITSLASMTTSTTLNHVTFAGSAQARTITNSLLQKGARGVVFSGGGPPGVSVVTGVETVDSQLVAFEARGVQAAFDGTHADCAAGVAGTTGYRFGSNSSGTTDSVEWGAAFGLVDWTTVSDCDFGVQATAGSMVDVARFLAGTTTTSVLDVRYGGMIVWANGAISATGVNEISLDNAATTSTFAAVAVNNCVQSVGFSSRACKR